MQHALIVDDLPQNLYMLEVLLKSKGFEVSQATNGIEALDILKESKPSIIISDILMPGMDGFSLCKKLKSDPELRRIPLVFYTATYTDPRDQKLALSQGADRFLVKPMEVEDFMEAIHEVLNKYENENAVKPIDEFPKEKEFFKEYNETLIRKLEDKMLELQKVNQKLTSLYKASIELHDPKPFTDLLPKILETIIQVGGYQKIVYYSYSEPEYKLTIDAGSGFSDGELDGLQKQYSFDMHEDEEIICQVAKSRKPLIINNLSNETHWSMKELKAQSALLTPVTLEKKLFGVICLFDEKPHGFNEGDELNISVLANSMAIALENKTNIASVTKQLKRISVLHDIDLAISNSMDLTTTLNILLEHVKSQMGVDAVTILLEDESIEKYRLAANRGFTILADQHDWIREGTDIFSQTVTERKLFHTISIANQKTSSSFHRLWNQEGIYTYVAVPLIAKGKVVGILETFHHLTLRVDAEWLDFLETLAGQAAIAIDNHRMYSELQESHSNLVVAYDATIKGWSRAMDLRDKETEGHTQRVVEMAIRFAKMVGVRKEALIHIHRGALLHDMGKLGVPDSILLKPGPLNEEEWVVMRKHPKIAYEMLSPIDYLKPALEIPYYHHEKWDGTGYPVGLRGEEIPLAARIFAFVDVWDSLSSDRPYRKAWPIDKVIAYIREQSGLQFDPNLVEPFIHLISDKYSKTF